MKARRTETTCDLCGFRSDSENLFTARGPYDLCKWCMSSPLRQTSCGGHTVDVADGSWQCDCGELYGALVLRLRTHGVSLGAMNAAPDLATATAVIHVQTPNWPRP